jgi:hypothetical protein
VILSSLVALLSLSASASDVWKEADPATLGMDVQAVREHERLCERTGADACLVVQGDSIGHPLSPHHGLLWWILDEPRGFAARGHLDTNLYVFPGLDLVVVRMQARPSGREGAYEREALALFRRMVSDVPAREGTR